MPTALEAARATRATTWTRANAIARAAAAEGRNFTAAEQADYDAAVAELDQLDARIADLAAVEQRAAGAGAAMAALVGNRPVDDGRCWLPSRSEYHRWAEESRATGSAGAFIPVEYAATYWDRLRNASVFLAAGPRILTIEHAGSLVVPKVTASVTVSGVAEYATITESDPTLGSITLTPKKFAALSLISNEALADSAPALRQVVADDLLKQTATVLDAQFLTGSGSGQNLTGLVSVSGISSVTYTTAISLDGLADTIAKLESVNGNPDTAHWFVSPTDWATVRKLSDSQDRYQLSPDPSRDAVRQLFGVPVSVSANVTSGDVLLVDMSQVVVGRAQEINVQFSTDYAFNADQTALRVTARFDVGVMNPAAVVLGTVG